MKTILIAIVFIAIFAMGTMVPMQEGPADNSGDGVSDGSGLESPFFNGENGVSLGGAPNAGDGIPDGSGF